MRQDRIFATIMLALALLLGTTIEGFYGAALAGNDDPQVVPVPGAPGFKMYKYPEGTKFPQWYDMSGHLHEGSQGVTAWRDNSVNTAPPPPVQEPTTSPTGVYGPPGATNVMKGRGGAGDFPDTKAQMDPNAQFPSTSRKNSGSPTGSSGRYGRQGFTKQQLDSMTPEERELARRGIIHPGRDY